MSPLLIDEMLPVWDVASVHRIEIAAPAAVVYRKARTLDLSSSRGIRLLLRLRGLRADAINLDGLERAGFSVLVEQPRREMVIGLIGKFWTPSGGLVPTDAGHFRTFSFPGYAKAAWNFVVDVQDAQNDGRVVLTTETRVLCLDPASRRLFRRYWRVVGPFSGWIRRRGLAIVRDQSENSDDPILRQVGGSPAAGARSR